MSLMSQRKAKVSCLYMEYVLLTLNCTTDLGSNRSKAESDSSASDMGKIRVN